MKKYNKNGRKQDKNINKELFRSRRREEKKRRIHQKVKQHLETLLKTNTGRFFA